MTTSAELDLVNSFERLKREARNEADISAWFLQHREALDPVDAESIESVAVDLTYPGSLVSLFFEGHPDEIQGLVLLVIRKSKPPPRTHLLESLQALSKDVSPVTEQWTISAPVAEWSFMVARMAEEYVVREYWRELYRGSNQATAYLSKVLPKHFPGWTPESLRSLDQADLLPTDMRGAVAELLFTSRTHEPTKKTLPPDMQM